MRLRFSSSRLLLVAILVAAFGQYGAGTQAGSQTGARRLAREVTHELATLPWYGVFDWIEGNVSSDARVTLKGWVARESTRADAEQRIRDVEGVTAVVNEFEVLPLSPADNCLRRSLYLELFEYDSPLF